MKVVKRKNFLVFEDEKTHYTFNLSNGRLYSAVGVPMTYTPCECYKVLEETCWGWCHRLDNSTTNFLLYLMRWRSQELYDLSKYADLILFCDKLDSIGHDRIYYSEYDLDKLNYAMKNSKKFFKEFNKCGISVFSFANKFQKQELLQRLGLKVNDYYTKPILDYIYCYREKFNDKELKYIAYYLSRGVDMFFLDLVDFNDECFDINDRSLAINEDRFIEFFRMCEIIGHEPTKSDFFKQYLSVKKTYITNKTHFDEKAIPLQLNKHKDWWDFEDDNYTIVVPQTIQDFKDEAEYQDNCVYNMYMQKVINGETNVVFIRDKDDIDTPLITCEVQEDGFIEQFLLECNEEVEEDSTLYKFKLKFQNYIYEKMGE